MTILWIITAWVLLDRLLRCLSSWLEYCEARELDRLEWLEGEGESLRAQVLIGGATRGDPR